LRDLNIRCSFVTENCSHGGACWWRDGGVGQGKRTSIGGCFGSMSRVYASCEGVPPPSALSTGGFLNRVALTFFFYRFLENSLYFMMCLQVDFRSLFDEIPD